MRFDTLVSRRLPATTGATLAGSDRAVVATAITRNHLVTARLIVGFNSDAGMLRAMRASTHRSLHRLDGEHGHG
ncbi:hypothetical protein RE6C_02730 [Rhodopirellula europaea 6C]|uniref:Uncharacterized protein n=1 Tax=Rhodopirellula europaea 6C TaxID=1263867 RepID=M2AGV8_9BACT|nr:hypothetical protein RE6C_02730 [Rhodopirellula europaea 6C]